GQASLDRHPASFWLVALELADFFDSSYVMNIAKQHLCSAKDLHPAARLHLVMQYRVDEWIERSFRALIDIPLHSLTLGDIHQIGFSPYIILAETKAKIAERRAFCSLTPPSVEHAADCHNPVSCFHSWAHAWWGEAGKQGVVIVLVHPTRVLALIILERLPDIETSWHMLLACRNRTIKSLIENPSVLLREEMFIAKAIKELKKF
ncbi:hypothetical protein B0H14DRAFT_2307266, partial [Mycena olivaceomarginata]